jgi:hypothetical protein
VTAASGATGATGPPGPLGEEAARFVEALSDWTRLHVGDMPGAVSQQIGGSSECRLCPFCQALALLRSAKPETFGHLVEASAALTAALRSVVETHGHDPRRGGVERIDLDGDP